MKILIILLALQAIFNAHFPSQFINYMPFLSMLAYTIHEIISFNKTLNAFYYNGWTVEIIKLKCVLFLHFYSHLIMVTKIEIVLKKPVRKQKIFLQHYLVMLVLEKNIPDLNNCIFIMIQSLHSQV